ncbi:MAG TPA: molybdopterin cofactor-binding domain-containing protein, partial [Stellaceae bacterium]|nr:molybdopterin cofactor-binding domain-containing protein [Stellaceae bacterium]
DRGLEISYRRRSHPRALAATGDRFDAAYELPFLAHATMEPLNCTVHLTPDSCEIWTGTQIMARVQSSAAKAAGLPVEKVTVNQHLIGGGFGRRLEPDMVVAAVRIAKQVDGPVKVVWTREEDVRHDVYRPVYRDTISATLSDGKIVGWKYKITGSAVIARWLPPAFQKGIDIDAIDSATDIPYEIPNFHVEYVRAEPPAVPTGFWRGVGPNNNVFAIECFMDELARKAGKDPVALRRSMLANRPRFLAALDLVAEKSNWGQPLPARVGRGVCVQPSFASFIATVVEAEIDEQGEVHLRRVTSAVDTGIVVNPDTIRAQIEGGLIFGLTAALYGEITIDKGRVEQSNFHDYRMLRIDQAPRIEVHLIKSGEAPGGIGETGVTAGPPALRNAILAVTGVALRRLPIDRALIRAGNKA